MDWWKRKNGILQIYPRSYMDSNADGIGDLPGIIQKLDYIKDGQDSLDIDAIWLSPFYPSPMADYGYDVANYCDVDPVFGSLEDFKQLVEQAHHREISVMIDLVPNHTSDQHPWFKEAISDRNSPKRDYYIFRDAKEGTTPNNWQSVFGGPGWHKDEQSGQYYLHSFLKEQPDLNWTNPAVQQEFRDIVSFWCELGVDGFRLDAINWLGKHPDLPDEPLNENFHEASDPYDRLRHIYSQSTAELDTYLRVMTSEIKKYPGKIMLFETYTDSTVSEEVQLRRLYDVDPTVAAPFHFGGIHAGRSAPQLASTVYEGEKAFVSESAQVYCFGNHDKPRLVSRVGREAARVTALIQLTLPGIPVVYYGEEIGMEDVPLRPDQIRDPFERQVPGKGLGRDIARTPMQWDESIHAGFTSGDSSPWLPVHPSYASVNVAVQNVQPDSFLQLYKKLLRLRTVHRTLRSGVYRQSFVNDELYIYTMSSDTETFLIIANLSDHAHTFNLPEGGEMICTAQQPDLSNTSTVGLSHVAGNDAYLVRYDAGYHATLHLFEFFR